MGEEGRVITGVAELIDTLNYKGIVNTRSWEKFGFSESVLFQLHEELYEVLQVVEEIT